MHSINIMSHSTHVFFFFVTLICVFLINIRYLYLTLCSFCKLFEILIWIYLNKIILGEAGNIISISNRCLWFSDSSIVFLFATLLDFFSIHDCFISIESDLDRMANDRRIAGNDNLVDSTWLAPFGVPVMPSVFCVA